MFVVSVDTPYFVKTKVERTEVDVIRPHAEPNRLATFEDFRGRAMDDGERRLDRFQPLESEGFVQRATPIPPLRVGASLGPRSRGLGQRVRHFVVARDIATRVARWGVP